MKTTQMYQQMVYHYEAVQYLSLIEQNPIAPVLLEKTNVNIQLPIAIYEDNAGCILLATHLIYDNRTKHISTRYHLLSQGTINGTIIVKYVQTQLVIVDAWTKPLGKIQFSH